MLWCALGAACPAQPAVVKSHPRPPPPPPLESPQPLLTPSGYDALVHLVLDKLVARLEAVLSQKRFTQLGGLQLEKDVRLLVGEWRESS